MSTPPPTPPLPPSPPSSPPPPPPPPPKADQAPISEVLVGRMFADRKTHHTRKITEWLAFLGAAQEDDTIVTCGDDVAVLDGDTHHWSVKPSPEALQAHAATLSPAPDFWYISHGLGLKGIYIGPRARDRASLGALSMPRAFKVEMANHFRHPAATSSKHGVPAGKVHANANAGNETVCLQSIGSLRSGEVDKLLAELGLARHQRYDHSRCLIAGEEPSDAGDCVSTLDSGIYCYRCAGKGLCYPGLRKAGFVPYTVLAKGASSIIDRLTKNWVHWEHAQHELIHEYPHLTSNVLRDIYRIALEQRYTPSDPRIPMVFNSDLVVAHTTVGWVDSRTFSTTKLDNDLVDSLPAVLYLKPPKEAGDPPETVVDRVRRSTFKNRQPSGHTPLQPFRGICLFPNRDAIPVEVPPKQAHPIEILADPVPQAEAMAIIEAAFPSINEAYLMGCLCAMICGEAGGGQPPAVTATGPSGSGKGETINLAASLLGDEGVKVQLQEDPDAFMRQMGASTAAGRRCLIFDELGKTRGLSNKIAHILQVGAKVTFRPLYSTSTVTVSFRSAIFFPCVYFPDFLCASPEFIRRTRGVHLSARTPNWRATSGGDTADWRSRSAANARVGNSLLTHAYRLCQDSRFIFDGAPGSVADRLGLGSIADGAEGIDPIHLVNLYRYARGDHGERRFFEKDPTFAKGWLDLDAPQAKQLISVFAAGDDNQGKAWKYAVKNNLQAACWNDVLGFSTPPVTIDIKIHGSQWGMRFRLSRSCKRGDEVLNDALPSVAEGQPAGSPDVQPTPTGSLAEILATSGFPSGESTPPASSADMLIRMLKDTGLLGSLP